MNKGANMIKRIAGTLFLPILMFLIMYIFCHSNGVDYFGAPIMWRSLIVDIAISVTCAMGIGLQFKSGRFDFSGGSIMLFAAIIAGNISRKMSNNIPLFILICLGMCVALSIAVSLVYVYGRLPIMITTIGMALLFEAITPLIYGGSGINLVSNLTLRKFSSFPWVLVPFAGAVVVYAIFSYVSKIGKQSVLLAKNQQVAANIGISEKKVVIISYVFSGLIFGFATMIYTTTGIHAASFASLSTVGELFTNILPVFVGLYVGVFCGDTIGIIIASVAICMMRFGLQAVLSAEMGSAVSTAMMGIFILLVNLIAGQASNIKLVFKRMMTTFGNTGAEANK